MELQFMNSNVMELYSDLSTYHGDIMSGKHQHAYACQRRKIIIKMFRCIDNLTETKKMICALYGRKDATSYDFSPRVFDHLSLNDRRDAWALVNVLSRARHTFVPIHNND